MGFIRIMKSVNTVDAIELVIYRFNVSGADKHDTAEEIHI